MRITAFSEVRNGKLRANEGSARINLLDQIEALDLHIFDASRIDSTCVVDEDIDASERLHRFIDSCLDAFGVPDVALDWQSPPTCGLYLCGGRVDRTRQFRLLGHRLRCNGNVSAVFGAALGDLEADTARGPRDENGLSAKITRL